VALLEIKDATNAKQTLKNLIPLVNSAENWDQNDGSSVSITFTYKGLEKIGKALSERNIQIIPKISLASFFGYWC
jgi:hypothetical protein